MSRLTLSNSVIIKTFIAITLTIGLGACSKEPPPTQPPVVINLTNSSQVPNQISPQATQQSTQTQQDREMPRTFANNMQTQPQYNAQQMAPTPSYQQPRGIITQAYSRPQPSVPSFEVEHLDEASFFNTQIHEMAMQLLKNFRGETGPDGPIVVTTFVDLNNLYRTSPFGRYIAEQLMGELQRAGFNVVEIRKTEALMIKPRFGEYGLSREIQEIARQSSARYVLAGTYVTRGRYILINARVISNENNLVASSGLKILRRDPFLEKMLWPTASPESVPAVRVPVKELGSLTEVKIMSGS